VRGLKVTAADLPDYVERVLRNYEAARDEGESFAQWTVRAAEAELA
jgi:sulfite reductase (ferredoxin)